MQAPINLFYPNSSNKYRVSKTEPIFLRIVCAAGVNRSATLKKYFEMRVSASSLILPSHGIIFADYENADIISYRIYSTDGFSTLFGHSRGPSMQSLIFKELGYEPTFDAYLTLESRDKIAYKRLLKEKFWNRQSSYKNIFIVVTEDPEAERRAKLRLKAVGQEVDLIMIRIEDIIHEPANPDVKAYSPEAFNIFLDAMDSYFEFY